MDYRSDVGLVLFTQSLVIQRSLAIMKLYIGVHFYSTHPKYMCADAARAAIPSKEPLRAKKPPSSFKDSCCLSDECITPLKVKVSQ